MNTMNKQRGLVMVGILAMAIGSALAVQDRQVTVESKDGKRVHKRVDHEGRVRLVRQLSDKPCREGRTWGQDRTGIWVSDGCRAVFAYSQSNGNRPDWTKPTQGIRTIKFKLESDGRRETRRIDTSGGVKMIRQLSDTRCVQGRSWGYDRNSVWVDNGCRAEFEVRTRNNDNDNPWSGVGNGVPRWAIGDWKGGNRVRAFSMNVRSDGSLTIRRNNDTERGSIRGSRVMIGRSEYKLERRGDNGISLVPVQATSGRMDFTRS